MKIDSSTKPDAITEAALKRFIRFGFNKTSFTEIARDLGVSQQSLYYYFPDKKTLIREVINKVNGEYLSLLEEKFGQGRAITDKLMELVNVKAFFFEKYFMIADASHHGFDCQEDLENIMKMAKEKQLQMVTREIETAITNKEIRKISATEAAELLMEVLDALQYAIKKKDIFPNREEIARVFKRQRELITIYVAGLKHCGCEKNDNS